MDLLSNIYQPAFLRRQRNHPPLLIFPADLVVWEFLVFLCFFFFFIIVATFLLQKRWSVGSKGHNCIWSAFHQLSWDGRFSSYSPVRQHQLFKPYFLFLLLRKALVGSSLRQNGISWLNGVAWRPCLGSALLVGNSMLAFLVHVGAVKKGQAILAE